MGARTQAPARAQPDHIPARTVIGTEVMAKV